MTARRALTSIVMTILTMACLAWVIGFIRFAANIPETVWDPQTRTDAIVVLTGGSERISTGVTLLDQGVADKLFISGVGALVNVNQLIDAGQIPDNSLSDRIALGAEAEDTPGNALETARWVAREEVTSLRLVTAAYHMPRSIRELERSMPHITIIPHPVFPDHVKEEWWRHPGTAMLIAGEFMKFVFSGVRLWFDDSPPAPENTALRQRPS